MNRNRHLNRENYPKHQTSPSIPKGQATKKKRR